jgi:chemotaxis regulatin CheY-phosphate phosphatase CheZ
LPALRAAALRVQRGTTMTVERLERVIDSIEAVAQGQGAMAAAEWGLGDRRESYITNPASRNLLKGLVREARAALASPEPDEEAR